MPQIRQEIGVCLQHDCLFPQLTVKEHIQLFTRIKGLYARLSHAEAEAKVAAAIQDVALSEKSKQSRQAPQWRNEAQVERCYSFLRRQQDCVRALFDFRYGFSSFYSRLVVLFFAVCSMSRPLEWYGKM